MKEDFNATSSGFLRFGELRWILAFGFVLEGTKKVESRGWIQIKYQAVVQQTCHVLGEI